MIVAKGLPVLVTAALAVALVRTPGHSRSHQPHFSVLGRRLWRFDHPASPLLRYNKHPSLLIPTRNIGDDTNDIEALNKNFNEGKELLFTNDKNNILPPNPLSKRNDNEETQYYTTPSKCVCPEQEGYYDLGFDHYPRHIYGKICAPDGIYTFKPEIFNPLVIGGSINCQDNDPDLECCQPHIYCKQIIYPVHVLTKRSDLPLNYEVKGVDYLPDELRSAWNFTILNASTACVLINP